MEDTAACVVLNSTEACDSKPFTAGGFVQNAKDESGLNR